MPSIIDPPPPPETPNVSAEVPTSGGLTLLEGQLLYTTSISRLLAFSGSEPGASNYVLSNAGTLWVDYAAGAQIMYQTYWGTILNSGTIVAHSANGEASTITIGSGLTGFYNSGAIYALSDTGFANAVEYWNSSAEFENSGLIAARGATWAYAVRAFNGGSILNLSGGEILAEGAIAAAVTLRNANSAGEIDVLNHGRIAANSTDAGNASIAIQGDSLDIENHGIISADIAILGTYDSTSIQHPPEHVTNYQGGLIEGAILLDLGDDQLINRGQINGYIDMGEGADLVDNIMGNHVGSANLGWGDDTYLGGAGSDAVTGDRGADTINGGGSNDLLLGGFGNDLLRGDGGNDGLYGEGGDDLILTSAGDAVYAGSGNDSVELGDLHFRLVDGEAGYDTLVLPADNRILDLSLVAASGRVAGFEEVQLADNGRIVIRPDDVTQISGASALTVSAGGDGVVDLVGGWTAGSVQLINGTAYTSYTSGALQLLVDQTLIVNIGPAPAGATGLDAIAAGAVPPVPGSVPGAELTSNLTTVNAFGLASDLTIENSEQWASTGGAPVITSLDSNVSLYNYGVVESSGANGASAITGFNYLNLHNFGAIHSSAFGGTGQLAQNKSAVATYGIHNVVTNGAGNANAVSIGSGAWNFLNAGEIAAHTDQGTAVGYQTWMWPGENSGTITASSTHFIGVGVFAHNGGELVNSGTIEASGAWGAYGVGSTTHALMLNNSGSIIAHSTDGAHPGIAVYIYYASGTQHIANSGQIEGEIAIQSSLTVNGGAVWLTNSGEIEGRIELGINPNGGPAREDVILNSGTINGSVALGDGRDIYDGTGGTQIGAVKGEAGNDLLIGTSGRDTLDGGAGNDVLVGGGGDTLTGGFGSDVFVFNLVIAGRPANSITDFASGTDKIDLRALAPTSVTISGSTITAATSQGTLSITVSGSVSMADLVVSSATSTPGDDVLVASPGGETLTGGDGLDLLYGGIGNDRLDGGPGGSSGIGETADMMLGGIGNDTYVVDSGADVVVENANGGIDTIHAMPGPFSFIYSMPDHVENFIGGSGQGNDLDNLMSGGADGDSLDGGAGNDVITGLGGVDHLRGGAGADRFVYAALGDAPGVGDTITDFEHGVDIIDLGALNATGITFFGTLFPDLFTSVTIDTAGGPLTLQIDRYVDHSDFGTAFQSRNGTSGNDNLLGTGSSEWLEGGNGNDWLNGGAASDTLHGGDGDDALFGGAGRDALLGGAGADRFYLNGLSDSADRIGDFSAGDRIYLDAAVFAALATGELDASKFAQAGWVTAGTRIIYDPYYGRISYDPDGTGAAESAVIGYVPPGTQLTAAHFVVYSGNPHAITDARHDFNGDGRSDILWRNDDGRVTDWLGQPNGGFTGNANANHMVGPDWQAVGVGDFNGDGRDDLIWRNDDGRMIEWLGQANGGFHGNPGVNNNVATSWHVAGVGDFNGDGRDDILWRSDNGTVTDWLGRADGRFDGNTANANIKVGPDWEVAGVGDFNGDGRDDVIWRNDDGRMIEWLGQANGGFAANAGANYGVAPSWHVLGVGDFNGDGRDDILWRNDNNTVTNWLGRSDGRFTGNTDDANIKVGPDWQVGSIGDFNGDGRDDVIWRNDDGRMIEWLGQANGGFAGNASANYNVPTSWHVQAPDIF